MRHMIGRVACVWYLAGAILAYLVWLHLGTQAWLCCCVKSPASCCAKLWYCLSQMCINFCCFWCIHFGNMLK